MKSVQRTGQQTQERTTTTALNAMEGFPKERKQAAKLKEKPGQESTTNCFWMTLHEEDKSYNKKSLHL